MRLKDTGLTAQDIKDKVKKYMIETYERFDFIAETAEGMYLYDENGTPYLDFYAGIAVNNAGSRNPKVVAAVKDQVDDIMHTFNYPYTIPQALLAEKVCKTIGMDKIFYQNSGTEANEAMIKMARKYGIEKYGPNRYHIVTAKDGFHGRTFGAMSATGQPGNGCQVGFGPMTYGFSYAPYNDLKAFKDACTENTIAIMIEPVQGEGGVHPATPEFMKGLREFCDEKGMLLLIDEVQTGWCRTGAVMSYMNYGIKPDIVSMAKLHPKHKTPINSLILIGVLTMLAPFAGRKMLVWISDAGNFGCCVAYCMVALSFIILRKKEPDMPRPYKVPAYRFFGTMAVIMSGFMVAMYCIPGSGGSLIAQEWGIVLAWCALGVVFFVFCKKKYKESFGTLVELISDEDAATLMPEADEAELDKVIDAAIDRVLAKKAS